MGPTGLLRAPSDGTLTQGSVLKYSTLNIHTLWPLLDNA